MAPAGPRRSRWPALQPPPARHRHGALLTGLAGTRPAWIYVFPGTPGHKMRWRSVIDGSLREETAVIELEQWGDRSAETAVVDLATDSFEGSREPT